MKYPLNILVVDDVEEISEGMCRILNRYFQQCFTAANGLEALEVCEREEIHAIVTDLVMPHMDGLSLLQAVRERYPQIYPVVVITGEASAEVIEAVKEMKLPTFVKPLDVDALLNYFESVLEPPKQQ